MSGQLESRDVRRVEWHIRHEREIRDAVTEAKNSAGGHTSGAPSGHGSFADHTAAQAIRNTDELRSVQLGSGETVEYPERWLSLIDAVRAWCVHDYVMQEIFTRVVARREWLPRSARRRMRDNLCEKLHIEKTTFYAKIDAIYLYAAGYAKGINLL